MPRADWAGDIDADFQKIEEAQGGEQVEPQLIADLVVEQVAIPIPHLQRFPIVVQVGTNRWT